MRRAYQFAKPDGTVTCVLATGRSVTVPVFPGLLKHLTTEALREMLAKPPVVRKYTVEALRHAAWPLLREFPADWLKECLDAADLRPSRRKAVLFLLG